MASHYFQSLPTQTASSIPQTKVPEYAPSSSPASHVETVTIKGGRGGYGSGGRRHGEWVMQIETQKVDITPTVDTAEIPPSSSSSASQVGKTASPQYRPDDTQDNSDPLQQEYRMLRLSIYGYIYPMPQEPVSSYGSSNRCSSMDRHNLGERH